MNKKTPITEHLHILYIQDKKTNHEERKYKVKVMEKMQYYPMNESIQKRES